MDDMYGGRDDEVRALLPDLKEHLMLKVEYHPPQGGNYEHLKRLRERTQDYSAVKPNPRYLEGVKQLLGLFHCKAAASPSVIGKKAIEGEDVLLKGDDIRLFRSALGSMAYYALDREDIQYELDKLAKQMAAPTVGGLVDIRRVVRYRPGVADRPGGGAEAAPTVAGKVAQSRRLHGFGLGGRGAATFAVVGPCCFRRELPHVSQQIIATSGGEAEFYALASGHLQGIYFKEVMEFFGYRVALRMVTDSSAARGMARREGVGRVKHLSTRVLAGAAFVHA